MGPEGTERLYEVSGIPRYSCGPDRFIERWLMAGGGGSSVS